MRSRLGSLVARGSRVLREEKIAHLASHLGADGLVLDIGVWCRLPEPNPSDNWLEKRHGGEAGIVALGLDDMREFHRKYPGVLCVQGDGCALPFEQAAFAAAFSNAVLEHVPTDKQRSFVEEMARVVSHRAVLAVPDRLCPIEIHSRIFILHWFPTWRQMFRWTGQTYWSLEEHLTTIFTKHSLRDLLRSNNSQGQWKIKRQYLWFIPVSLIAIFVKDGAA